MGQYHSKGLYNSYNKANKERDALDYYATPPEEVTNILNYLALDLTNQTILEPCAGQGHMVRGLEAYIAEAGFTGAQIMATEYADRNPVVCETAIKSGKEFDFLADNYPCESANLVIMNPPYAAIEPFVIRGLEIAQDGLLLLARLQFLEGKGRYDTILKDNPPSDTYVYVDRIKCYKNGDFEQKESSAQAYAWFYWDLRQKSSEAKIHWIRRK